MLALHSYQMIFNSLIVMQESPHPDFLYYGCSGYDGCSEQNGGLATIRYSSDARQESCAIDSLLGSLRKVTPESDCMFYPKTATRVGSSVLTMIPRPEIVLDQGQRLLIKYQCIVKSNRDMDT